MNGHRPRSGEPFDPRRFKGVNVPATGVRVAQQSPDRPRTASVRITQPSHLWQLREMRALRDAEQEHNYAIGLDSSGVVLVVHLAAVGTVDRAQSHTRDVFRALIRCNCTRFIFVHNHPGGPREPSESDRDVTRWLATTGEWLGIPLDAHLLIAGDGDPVVVDGGTHAPNP